MYKVEFIYKDTGCIGTMNFQAMGKKDESINNEAGFIFETDYEPYIESGFIRILANNSYYWYNMADFYRVKITHFEHI